MKNYRLWIDQVLWQQAGTEGVIFSVTAGPGILGLVLRQEGRQISTAKPGEPAIIEEVIYVDTEESLKLHGILSKALQNIPFFAKNPSLLAINRTSAIIH